MAKHPVPKKKTSKGRTGRRYKAFQNRARKQLDNKIQLLDCSNCGTTIRAHHVCPDCGFYQGKQVGKVKETPKVTTIKAD